MSMDGGNGNPVGDQNKKAGEGGNEVVWERRSSTSLKALQEKKGSKTGYVTDGDKWSVRDTFPPFIRKGVACNANVSSVQL